MDKIISFNNLSRYNNHICSYIDTKVNETTINIIGDAPEALNTIEKLANELLINFASKDVVTQMIADNNANIHIYCTNEDILRIFDPSIPNVPVEPEVPNESVGSITEDNSIVIDETQLENGIYTLKYIDSDNNIIDNFNEITSFEIN